METINIIFASSGFFNAASIFIFGSFIIYKNWKKKIFRVFYYSCLSFIIWSFFYGFWQLSSSAQEALFWSRMFSLGSTAIPIFFLHIIVLLIDKEKETRKILTYGYAVTIFFLFFNFSPLFISGIQRRFEFSYWPIPGPMYTIFLITDFFFIFFYGIYLLFKNYRESTGVQKERIKYATMIYILPILGGCTNFPYWYGIKVPPYGTFFTFLFPFIMGYLTSRYTYFDIKYIFGRIVVYIFSIFSAISVSFSLHLLNNSIKFIDHDIALIIALAIGIIIYKWFLVFFEKLEIKFLYRQNYSREKVLVDLEKSLLSTLNLDRLIKLITETIQKTFRTQRIAFLIKSEDTDDLYVKNIIGFQPKQILNIANNLLAYTLRDNEKVLIYDEIMDARLISEKEKYLITEIRENIKINDTRLFAPLFRNGKMAGLIILGSKESKNSYSKQDIDLFNALSSSFSIALENAKLYEEIRDLSQNLQHKVDEQTKNLKKAYESEKSARIELEKLDETKNQFLLAVQHHLRTPLTSMKWGAETLLKQKQSKKNKEAISNLQKSADSLIKMANEFLDITQFKMGKEVIVPKTGTDIRSIISEIISELGFEVKTKGIKLNFRAESNIPKITADTEKLKLALYNIIDNAVKYTNRGQIDVAIEAKDNFVRISVKDTGIGMSQETIANLFSKVFERGQEARQVFVTGRGIGLFISGKIITAHKGKIWAESKGESKGSVFYIELPA